MVWDSAGVIIVDNAHSAPDSRLSWKVGTQPSLSIGAVDSGEADQLFGVTDATRLSDGKIVIANSGSNELRVFSPDGSHAGTWGGQGEGPGEFTVYSPTAVVSWPGDSVAAPNPWALRLSIFDTDGNYGRDVSLGAGFPDCVGLLADGRIVAKAPSANATVIGNAGIARWDAEWAILAGDEQRESALGAVRDMPLVESFPAFSEILSDLAGNLWVQEYQMPGEEAVVWTVFDPGGRIRGLIETPADLEVFKIGEDYILGRVRDELGVEYVQLWSLDRGAG